MTAVFATLSVTAAFATAMVAAAGVTAGGLATTVATATPGPVVTPRLESPGIGTVTGLLTVAGGSTSVKSTSVVSPSPMTTETDDVVSVPPRLGVPESTVSAVLGTPFKVT